MNDIMDKISYMFKLATDVLLVKNPVGTSMGVLFGFVLDFLINISGAFFSSIQIIKSSGVGLFHYIAIGVFGFNIKSWRKKDEIDPKIMAALDFIENQIKQGHLTPAQGKLKFNEIITKVVEDVRLDSGAASKLRTLAK